MKELIREYQSVLITSVSCLFVFICIYITLPMITNEASKDKVHFSEFEIIKEENINNISLNYPKGEKIKLVKGSEFDIGNYVEIIDKENGTINNYKCIYNINGKKQNEFNTDTCGGYYLCLDIEYKQTKLQGELLIIVEER